MGILLSHNSAYYAQLQQAASGKGELESSRMVHVPYFDARAVDRVKEWLPEGVGVELVVPNSEDRHYGQAKCHVWSGSLPPGSVRRLEKGVYVSSPEFLFLQMASRLPFVRLVQFGYELCALHTVRLPGSNYLELKNPLTSADRIASYLDGCSSLFGAKQARKAIPWVLDRSRSPAETDFAISFTLPRMKGGQAIRGLELNKEFPLTKKEQRLAGKWHYEVDFCFEGIPDAFEYYGEESHEGPIRTVKDIRRESILKSKGVIVHGITKTQVKNVKELERLAELVTKSRGKRWQTPTRQQEIAMIRLLNELYPTS